MEPMLVGLYGYPGSGKDEAAKALVKDGWERISFADPMKVALLNLDPYITYSLEISGPKLMRLRELCRMYGTLERVKRKYEEVRRLLQMMGTECGREIHGEDCWLEIAKRQINYCRGNGLHVVVPDVRFPNEAQLIRDLRGYLVHVERLEAECRTPTHESETHYNSFEPDAVLDNNGTVVGLHAAVRQMVADFTEVVDV